VDEGWVDASEFRVTHFIVVLKDDTPLREQENQNENNNNYRC
jgi:hypothetical protein